MTHISYHLLSDHHNEFKNSISEVRSTLFNWETEGEDHIELFKIETEELDDDVILLDEHEVDVHDLKLQ